MTSRCPWSRFGSTCMSQICWRESTIRLAAAATLSLQVDASTMAPIKDLAVGQATKISAVAIGFLHSESIRQMPDFLHVAIGQEDFDDVEADFHRRVSEQAQVIESGAGKALSPLAVHCGSRP